MKSGNLIQLFSAAILSMFSRKRMRGIRFGCGVSADDYLESYGFSDPVFMSSYLSVHYLIPSNDIYICFLSSNAMKILRYLSPSSDRDEKIRYLSTKSTCHIIFSSKMEHVVVAFLLPGSSTLLFKLIGSAISTLPPFPV